MQLIEDNRSQSEARSQIIWSQQRQLEARQKRNRLKQVWPATKAACMLPRCLYEQRQLRVRQIFIKQLDAACRSASSVHAWVSGEHR